eukprot:2199600-Ditylum_brightwellii.AAC.1
MYLQGKEARQLTWPVCNQGKEGIRTTTGTKKSNRVIEKEKEALNAMCTNKTKKTKNRNQEDKSTASKKGKEKNDALQNAAIVLTVPSTGDMVKNKVKNKKNAHISVTNDVLTGRKKVAEDDESP